MIFEGESRGEICGSLLFLFERIDIYGTGRNAETEQRAKAA